MVLYEKDKSRQEIRPTNKKKGSEKMFEEGVLKFLWEETDFLCELPDQIIEAIKIELNIEE